MLRASLDEVSVYDTLTQTARFGAQSFARNVVPAHLRGGLAVATDASGNFYQATGSFVAKYNPAGTLLWSQTQSPHQITVAGMPPVVTNYDRWEDQGSGFTDIQLANAGQDPGELANCFARKIVLDGAGNVIVAFVDLRHHDRFVVAKFDGDTGEVLWVARTGLPYDTEQSNKYVSDILDLAILPGNTVAVLETGIGSGRWVFTRLVIFTAAGTAGKLGDVVRSELVRRNDGGDNTRDSIGVGLAVDSGGNLYYATHEGAVPGTWPTFPALFPTPDKLIIRKLLPPYTSSPIEVVHESAGIEHWGDLAVGPDGNIFVLGTDLTERPTDPGEDPEYNATPVLAAFNPTSLAENVFTRKSYPSSLIYPGPVGNYSITEWDSWGMEIHSTGTGADDTLYLLSGERDFRTWARPILNFDWIGFAPAQFSTEFVAFKVDSAGDVIWGRDRGGVSDSFVDESGHLYFIESETGVTLTKYSANGALQVIADIPNDAGMSTSGRSRMAILPSGNLVVAMEQGDDSNSATPFATSLRIFTNPAIAKASQTISFHQPNLALTRDTAVPLVAFSSSGLPVSYRIVTGNGEMVGSTLFGRAVGLLEVEAFHDGNDDFLAASPVKRQFWVAGAALLPQTITFNLAKTYLATIGAKKTLRATSTSGLSVTFTSSNPRILSISRNIATVRKFGVVTITAFVSGNTIYDQAQTTKTIRLKRPPKR